MCDVVCVPPPTLFILGFLALHTYEHPSLLMCVCLSVVRNCIPYLQCDCSPCPLSPLSPALAELQQAYLITSKERKRLSDISDVVRVQSGKSPEVMSKTADVLQTHGFEEESRLLAGRQSRPSFISLCYVVQWSLLMTATL